MMIIYKKNIEIIKKKFSDYQNITIFGKGATFKNIPKEEKELRCAINQASNFLDDVDLICMNDLHNVYKIEDRVYNNLKYLIIPEYLHINQSYSKKGHWKKVEEYLKKKFNGYLIIYNLKTAPRQNPEFINLYTGFSSANNCFEFFSIYSNLKLINLYGIGIYSKSNYHENFIGNGIYGPNRIFKIKNNIIQLAEKYEIKVYFN